MCPLVVGQLTDVVAVFLLAVVVPVAALAALVPTLVAGAPSVTNFRGNTVVLGLGVVWIIWALALALGSQLLEGSWISSPLTIAYVFPALLPLVGAAAVFGLVDDALGDSSAKGFKGHIGALMHGRLTTGGLKLLGIGAASLYAGVLIERLVGGGPVRVLLATVAIALSANLMNLFDLRPGRAAKVYIVLAVAAIVAFAFGMTDPSRIEVVLVALLALGPVAAIWEYDLGEHAMLGDAGANAMGAFVGFWFAFSMPLAAVAVYVLLVAALNFASEKVSFSKVIETTPLLSAIDRLGRRP